MTRKRNFLYTNAQARFFIDCEHEREILGFLGVKGWNKLKRYMLLISKNKAAKDIYSKEQINPKTAEVTAIKFKGGYYNNARIYCLDQMINNGREITLGELLKSKKQKKLTYKEENIIMRIGKYEY